MDWKRLKEIMTKRSSIWTLGLCMTGIIVLGGIAAVDQARRAGEEQQVETQAGELEGLDEALAGDGGALGQKESEGLAEASGSSVQDEIAGTDGAADLSGITGNAAENVDGVSGSVAQNADEVSGSAAQNEGGAADSSAESADGTDGAAANADGTSGSGPASADGAASEETSGNGEAASAVSSADVLSEQALLAEGISFSDDGEDALLWPAAGTILIDYSMDGSVYFPTLNQYKYNPSLVIGSETGNQVIASAKGVVESIYVDEETGTTLVMNIGNGYRLTYGQLKELAVEEGDVVDEGTVLGYVSEPTKYYSKEGSNLYFAMTQNDSPVDPVLYLE